MNNRDYENLLHQIESSKNLKESAIRNAQKEILLCEEQLANDLKLNKYSINKGKIQIDQTKSGEESILFSDNKIPSIIIFEGKKLEKRLENPFFLKPLTELLFALPNSIDQYWVKTSIHKKNNMRYLGASFLINPAIYNYTKNHKEFTGFESMWYSSLDNSLMNIMGFPGYEKPVSKNETMRRITDLSQSHKIGTLEELSRYNKLREYQRTPIEESVDHIQFKENYPNLFKS